VLERLANCGAVEPSDLRRLLATPGMSARGIWCALASGQLNLQRHRPMIAGFFGNIDQVGSR
jgi:hypothetical protein